MITNTEDRVLCNKWDHHFLLPESCPLYPQKSADSCMLNADSYFVQEGFGNVIATSGSADNNYHLTTKELDADVGLYYFMARWYDPSVGRFISKDPLLTSSYYVVPRLDNVSPPTSGKCGSSNALQGPQSLNPYTYTVNNPINLIDPTGGCSKGGGGGSGGNCDPCDKENGAYLLFWDTCRDSQQSPKEPGTCYRALCGKDARDYSMVHECCKCLYLDVHQTTNKPYSECMKKMLDGKPPWP